MDFPFPQYHQHRLKVRSYEVDLNQNLSVTAIFNYLQEIAWEHADNLQYGFSHLHDRGQLWALSRVEVEIYSLPRWTEELTLVTWPRGAEGIFALRDFELYAPDGSRAMAASSSWLILDINTRRPVRLTDWSLGFSFASRAAIGHAASKVQEPGGTPVFTEQLSVRIGDMDMNRHVNNVRYIDWAYNTLPVEHFHRYTPSRIAVNFNAEGRAGDTVRVERYRAEGNASVVSIGRPADSKNLCKLEFCWKEQSAPLATYGILQ